MPGVWRIATKYGTEIARPLDVELAELAERQHGVAALSQLRALGLSASAVRSRISRGRLDPVHRGVYAVGHRRLDAEGRWLAGVLACGDGALLSHRSAGLLWGLHGSARTPIDVTVPGTTGLRRPGIRVHRSETLRP